MLSSGRWCSWERVQCSTGSLRACFYRNTAAAQKLAREHLFDMRASAHRFKMGNECAWKSDGSPGCEWALCFMARACVCAFVAVWHRQVRARCGESQRQQRRQIAVGVTPLSLRSLAPSNHIVCYIDCSPTRKGARGQFYTTTYTHKVEGSLDDHFPAIVRFCVCF